MRRIVYLSLIIFSSVTARAEVTGLISNLIVTAATSAEMEETVFEPFCLVARGDSPNDLRLGDGITPGGLRVCPEGVLTNIPDSFPHPVAMNGNSIALNGAYSIGAEGPLWYLRANGSNVLSVLADVGELGSIVSEAYVGSNAMRIVVSVEDSALDPLVEFSPSLFTPAWTDCVYSATRPSANTVQLDIPLPDEERGYYRITALSGFRVRIGIPLEAPSVTADSITLGGETRTTWPSGAADVSNTAQAVLSASLASADTNSAASKQYVLDNAGTGGGGSSTKLITSWSIYGTQATNLNPVTTNNVQYINFAVNTGGGYVDQKRFVWSNATYKAAYITAYAYGSTGTCSLIVRVNSDEPTTNILNLSSSISTNSFALTNNLLPLSENTIDWGIVGGTATNDIRVRSFTIKVDSE